MGGTGAARGTEQAVGGFRPRWGAACKSGPPCGEAEAWASTDEPGPGEAPGPTHVHVGPGAESRLLPWTATFLSSPTCCLPTCALHGGSQAFQGPGDESVHPD